ncbi:MAG TPA: threonine aldolase family protein [Eoetvoesiella sp.]
MASEKIRIDLLSDTQTRPTLEMRDAMVRAEVGDEQHGEDPTTNKLCDMAAEILGKEAAVFLPSGVMCNQISILVHCRPGDEILTDEQSHLVGSEGAGAAVLAGAMLRPLRGRHGIYTADQVAEAIRPPKRNAPRTRLAVFEQAVNRGGGTIWPLDVIEAVANVARNHGLALHMDGARIFNASAATGITAKSYAATCDSVWLDLSKGLGCPVGAVLAGSADFIEQAWVWKHRLGGAMRQSGMLAAAGIYALENHIERLSDDNANAALFAKHIAQIPGIRLDPATIETNLVFFDVRKTGLNAAQIAQRLLPQGIRIGQENTYRMRAVMHLDVTRTDIEEAATALAEVVSRA